MAKQLVNPLERHVEKAVLGVAALVFLGAVAKYLVTSPNKVDLGVAGVVTAKTIDEKVSQKAEAVRQALRDARPRAESVDPLVDDFTAAAKPLREIGAAPELIASLPLGPDIPLIDTQGVTAERVKLVEVAPLPKPVLSSGRMLTNDPTPDSGGGEIATDWVTVSSIFDLGHQSDLQLRTYGSKWREVYCGPVQLQRRQRRPDLTWSDEDWKTVDCWPATPAPEPPPIPLVADGKNVIVPKDDYRDVEKFFEQLSRPGLQLTFLRPLPPPPAPTAPNSWSFPVITSLRDVAVQDDYFLYPEAPKSQNPRLERYSWLDDSPSAASPSRAPRAASDDPRGVIRAKFQEYEQHMKAAKETKSENEAIHAVNRCVEIRAHPYATADDRSRARRLEEQADQLAKDIRLEKAKSGISGPKADDPAATKTVVKRDPEPKQQVWAHDARPGSLVGGATYQYRMRMSVSNRLAGVPEKFENPADAQAVYVHGAWSEPSDPVTIEPATQVFVDGAERPKNEATLEVYQWFRGVWVTDRVKVKPGQTVNKVERKPTPDLDDPNKAFNAQVAFVIPAVVADVEFDRRARERKPEKNGVRFMPPEPGGSVVLMDSAGNLQEHVEGYDKADPRRKANKDRVWKPKR